MIYDKNNLEHQKLVKEAGNSKDGQIISDFIRAKLNELDYEQIDPALPFDQRGLEFEAMRKAKQTLASILRIINSEQ